ncbi:uncharacterized protein LOC143281592 [Babylonia areolata]|uniref:uncharacterized protein LOC143281592 n=1 Tax=Babylonia areolata TaxID=304850 RepID=UPI003FD35619
MNFTDSTTCLVDHELSFAEADSREYGGYYNSCAVPMEGDSGDSCSLNSSSSGSQNSSLVSPDRVYFPPPQTPSPPQHHNSHRQQCCQHKGRQHQEPQQWRNSSAEERETFSDYGISARMSDHHQRLDQQQTQEMLDQHLRLEQQQHQQHHYQQQQQQQHQGMLDHHLGLKQQQQHQGTPDHHHHQQQHQQHQRQQLHNQKGRPRSQICRSDGGAGEVMFFHSAKGVWDSLAYITSLTDMCDVVFHVGKARHPVYGVKSLLSVRSRVMYLKILAAQRSASASPKSKWKRLRHRSAADNDVITDGRIHVDVKDYDAQVFSQLVGFLHSGRVTVDADTVLGLYCAAAEYEVADLRTACWDFLDRCAQRNQTHSILMSGRSYLGRKVLDKLCQKFFTN